ncbi:dipeptidyl aminopeptidase/acylaminoacyl peptidase [Pedobacter sp. UYP30]|uniref:S9 family peptidase n=1 Tax=Pedobacter sp. UYP30 TaxID=1756400 RepID=UPI00339269CB
MLKGLGIIVLSVLLFCCKSKITVKRIPVDNFFKSRDKAYYRVSPDGKSLSYLQLKDNNSALFVENLATGQKKQLTNLTDKDISFYFWTSSNELIFYAEENGKDRKSDLFLINKNGGKLFLLNASKKSSLRVIEDQLIDNKYIVVLSNKRDSTVFDVYRLNVRDGKMQMAAKNPGNITRWMTDNKGILRMAIASDGVNETLLFRENERQPFKSVATNNFNSNLMPIAFSEKQPNVIYAISNVNRDKNALVTLNLSTGKEDSVLFANDSLDVINAKYSQKKGKILFVTCETWRKEKFYLDDSTHLANAKIDKLLPGTEWRIIDKDDDDRVFIIRTFTDRNPGSYYLYTSSDNNLKKLADINPSIKEENMSAMKPISFKAADGLTIHGYLTLPKKERVTNLPVVVLPHDGPRGRSSWGYNAEVQFLANRGYAVLQINYRGSSGYGKAFYSAGFKEWNGKIQSDVNDGVKWLITQKIANPNRIAIYGNGLGGYLALNCLYKNPKLYRCGGSNSGVINLFSYLKSIPPYFKSYLQMYYEVIGNPITDSDNLRMASPVFHADEFERPVFIAQNPNDPEVNVAEGIQFIKELKKRDVPVTYVEKEDGQNPIVKQKARTELYKSLEVFLNENLK